MLDIMRRKKRLKLILWLVIASLALGMLLFFVPGVDMGGGGTDRTAATVDGNSITLREYATAYRSTVRRISEGGRSQTDPETLKSMGLPKQILDELISMKVVDRIADRFGIQVTPAEVRRAVETHPSLQNQGTFIGVERYKALLNANSITVTEFEEQIHRAEMMSKLRDILTDSLEISESELREEFARTTRKTQVDYVLLKKEEYKKRVKPTDAELKAYFDAHKDVYRVKEKRRAQYLLVPIVQFFQNVQVSEDEILSEWNRSSHEETVEAAHILFMVSDGAKDAEVKAKAEEVLKRAKAGEDFTALAKKYSEDTGSAANGGYLGPFQKGRTVKEFEEVAFSMKPGEIAGLVKTQFGYHIIKVLKHETPTLELKSAELAAAVRAKKAQDLARQKAEEAVRLLEKQKDLGQAANKLGVTTEIKETGFFRKDDNPFDFGISQAIRDEIFEMKDVHSIGKAVEHTVGYAVPKLLEVQMPRPGQFSEFRAQVETDFADAKAKELVEADAKKLSAEAARLGSLENVAKGMGLSVKRSQEFNISGTPDPEIGADTPFNKAAFDLEPGGVSAPQSVYENTAVFQVKARTPFDETAFQKEKAELRSRMLQALRDPYFQDYVRRVTEDLEKAGKIRINPKAIDQVAASY